MFIPLAEIALKIRFDPNLNDDGSHDAEDLFFYLTMKKKSKFWMALN